MCVFSCPQDDPVFEEETFDRYRPVAGEGSASREKALLAWISVTCIGPKKLCLRPSH